MRTHLALPLALILFSAVGCNCGPVTPAVDGGSFEDDAGASEDAGLQDAGADAGGPDAGEPDPGEPDAGESDAGVFPDGGTDGGGVASHWVPVLFDVPVPIPNLPASFRLGPDVNGDGRLDAMATGYGNGSGSYLTLAISQPDGGYAVTFDGGFPSSTVFTHPGRDLDGDGALDLIVTEQLSNGYSHFFKGDGAGGFTFERKWRTTGRVIDLDGDRRLESVSLGSSSLFVESLLADGGTTYVTYPSLGASSLSPGDFNGDGLEDVLLIEPNRVYLGQADGGLVLGPVGTCTTCGAFGSKFSVVDDLDADGRSDLVTARDSLSVRMADPSGALQEVFSTPLLFGGVAYIRTGDVDDDGFRDIILLEPVIGVTSNDQLRVFFGGPNRQFTSGEPWFNAVFAHTVSHVADVDEDGLPDILLDGQWAILNRGNRELRTPALSRVSASSNNTAHWVDFDGDGIEDVALWQNDFRVHRMGPGRRLETPSQTCTLAPREPNEHRVMRELTGDGLPDAFSFTSGGLNFYVGQGGCAFGPKLTPLTGVWGSLVDVNGDGRADLLNQATGSLQTYLATGPGAFGAPLTTQVPGDFDSKEVADFSGDGHLDLVLLWTYEQVKQVVLATGDGAGGFSAGNTFTFGGAAPVGAAVGDVDGDGDRDIVIAISSTSAGAHLDLLRNDGAGGFAHEARWLTDTVFEGALQIRLADLDLDGRDELLLLEYRAQRVYSLLGPTPSLKTSLPRAYGTLLRDADGDGDLDLVFFHAYNQGIVGVYRNRTRD